MATNYVQPGKVITLTAPATQTSGSVVKVGSLVGIAMAAAASGAEVEVCVEGVFTVDKATGSAWTEGEKIYWDAAASKFTDTSTSNTLCGYAVAAAASGATSGTILLKQMGG